MKNDKITGYQLYNEDAKQRTKQNGLPSLYPELPNKRYDIIYADPPWHYNGKLQFDKTSTSKEKLDLNRKIFISSASFKYPTVKTKDLKKIPIQERGQRKGSKGVRKGSSLYLTVSERGQ